MRDVSPEVQSGFGGLEASTSTSTIYSSGTGSSDMTNEVNRIIAREPAKAYSARAVANKFIGLAKKDGITDLSPMKLQKLVYYAHGWLLANTGKPLINEEIQAWTYGPVVPDIFNEFRSFGNSHIDTYATELRFSNGKLSLTVPEVDKDDEDANEIIRKVWENCKNMTAIQLSNATHAKGTPWDIVASHFRDELPKNIEIPNALIEANFRKELEKWRDEENQQ